MIRFSTCVKWNISCTYVEPFTIRDTTKSKNYKIKNKSIRFIHSHFHSINPQNKFTTQALTLPIITFQPHHWFYICQEVPKTRDGMVFVRSGRGAHPLDWAEIGPLGSALNFVVSPIRPPDERHVLQLSLVFGAYI